MTRKFLHALATAVLLGAYAGFCLAIALLATSLVITPLETPKVFNIALATLTLFAAMRIFSVQIKKPS